MSAKFIYFDLGNVILHFSHERMCRQIGAVAGVSPEKVREVLFDGKIKVNAELGRSTPGECYEQFCRALDVRPDRSAWDAASDDIFELNVSILPLIVQLEAAGYRLGILSNICESHWKWVCDGRFSLLPDVFEIHAVSFRIHALKPDPKIYLAAAELAGVAPNDIFFMDDIEEHVQAARAVGFDAVRYTSTRELGETLRKRGIRSNF